METATLCPAGAGITFVPATTVGGAPGRPHYPYVCPTCAELVEDESAHPGLLTVDELIEFPYLLCGDGGVLLAEAGVRRRALRHPGSVEPVADGSAVEPRPLASPPVAPARRRRLPSWPAWRTPFAPVPG